MAGAVNKAFNVVRLLRRSPNALTLSEIARSVKIAPSTAHSILAELSDQGAVVQDSERRYRLGPAMFYYGASFARNAPIYRSTWRDLVGLGRELSLTAVVVAPWDNHHLILNVHEAGDSGIEVAFGGRVPIDAGAWGKAYFAWSGDKPPTRLTAYTSNTIIDIEAYSAEIERSRQLGYALDMEEFVTGAGAIAAPVSGSTGFEGIAALVGLISEIESIGENSIGRRLAAVVSRASYTLGDHSRMRIVGEE